MYSIVAIISPKFMTHPHEYIYIYTYVCMDLVRCSLHDAASRLSRQPITSDRDSPLTARHAKPSARPTWDPVRTWLISHPKTMRNDQENNGNCSWFWFWLMFVKLCSPHLLLRCIYDIHESHSQSKTNLASALGYHLALISHPWVHDFHVDPQAVGNIETWMGKKGNKKAVWTKSLRFL